MAKKRPKPGEGGPRRARKPPAPPPAGGAKKNPRKPEGVLQGGAGTDSPLEQAQEIVYQAMEERNPERRVRLAREALAVSADCADAYVLLAQHAPRRKQALELYRQGVAAGERALGSEAFQRDVGHFWGILETRPYMRARLGLAHVLWTVGQRDEAVTHLWDMLRLNPGDNQGVRYTLAGFLLFLDRDDDLARLLQQYPDDGQAAWAYTTALLAFRRHGDTIDTRRLLKTAKKSNKHVPDFLLGNKSPPAVRRPFYQLGDETEAQEYVDGFRAGWLDTPGAIAWLRANVKARKKAAPTEPKGPLAFVKKWLREKLPQEPDVWQADLRRMPVWMRVGGEMMRPWGVLVTNPESDLVLAHQIQEEAPPAELLWDTLVRAMQHPAGGEAHRPTAIEVRADERWESLRPHLEEIGIELTVSEDLEHLDFVFAHMVEHIFGKPRPGLLEMPGVTPELVGSFYQAAAAFYRQKPWKKVGYESAIRVECDRFSGGPWFGVLMGQSGLTEGLALYDDLAAIQQLWANPEDEQDNARESVATTVTFGEEWDLPVLDLEAAKQHGWEVARPEAYPEVFRKERGMTMRPPLAWELELLEGCLRAIPDFVTRRRQDDPTKEEFTIPVTSGELKLTLSWVVEPDQE